MKAVLTRTFNHGWMAAATLIFIFYIFMYLFETPASVFWTTGFDKLVLLQKFFFFFSALRNECQCRLTVHLETIISWPTRHTAPKPPALSVRAASFLPRPCENKKRGKKSEEHCEQTLPPSCASTIVRNVEGVKNESFWALTLCRRL